MKKTIALLLAVMMLLGVLSACAGKTADQPAQTETPAQTTETPAADASTEAPAADATAEKGKIAGVVFLEDQFMKLLQLGYKDTAEAAGIRIDRYGRP